MEWPADFPEDHAFVELVVPLASSELDFEQFLKDTEEKLRLNARSIEQQLMELQAKMGDCRTGERPPSPTECLHWFNLRAQSGVRHAATGHQELLDFFRGLQHYLKSEDEGREEVTLQLLLNLSSQCGVCFPCTPSSSSLSPLPPQLTASLMHTVREECPLEIQEVWDDVRLQLRRHLLERLSCASPECPGPRLISCLTVAERLLCLQQLCFLYPESEVFAHYQALRGQSVGALLHSAMSSSPSGVTGFDRLTAGFRAAVPPLTRALSEELLVLPRRVEPHATLGFINAAYLGTVAQELASMMERESETALRDNTTPSGKVKKYSSRSRASVAPMEPPTKSRSFSLTSHQLRALTQLACTLLGFESNVKELVTNMTFINCTGEAPCVKGILKKTKEDFDMAGDGKKSSAEAHTLEFDWRFAFRGLAPHMAHCVKVVLDDVCARSLQQEEASRSSGQASVILSDVNGRRAHLREDAFYSHSERETPRMIVKFCAAVTDEMDTLLPLAAACRDASLLEVRSSFAEACGRAAFAMLGRLEERALEVPSSAPLKNLPALLATCIYVQQRLDHYRARLKDPASTLAKIPLTLLPIQKYQDTVEVLRDQLTSYCVQVCSTCILQDAESHHWADPKPFYEGERCSFSVQMWFYFLCGLRSDLWAVLPAEFAKDVLGQVLTETLQLLVQRYAMAQPSYKRHLQIRCDITAVLLYVEQLMWSVCESPEALVGHDAAAASAASATGIKADRSDWPRQIHSLCDQLLTVLIIVTAPLSLLYRTLMINPAEDPITQRSQGAVVRWLNAIDPDIFTEQAMSQGLTGQVASACQLRLLTSDPGSNPRLLLRMLLDRDCHLPRVLLENSYFCQETDIEISPVDRKAGDAFLVSLFNIFICLNQVPKALTQALELYLERAHIWEHLYTMAETSRAAPVVVSCVRAVVDKSTRTLLTHLVSMVTSWQGAEETTPRRETPECVLAKIPKEWNYATAGARGKDNTSSKTVTCLAIQALSFIFTNLPLVVASLPLPVRYLFQVAEKHLSQHARQLRSVGLLLWAVLNCLIQGLEDPDTLEQISGMALDSETKERLALLAECLQASMGIQQKGVPKPTVHKVLQALEEKRPKWTNMQLAKSRKLCSDSVFERARESGGAAAELTEQKIGLMLLEVCHKAGGSDYLRQIYHIIQGNEELVMSKLGGSTDSSHPTHLVQFDLSDHQDANAFNPLLQFDQIGKKKLDQSAVVDWAWDWPRLLPAYQGMSRVTLKTLLANRWEMQDGAELEDGERAMVEELQSAYFVCRCGPGPQEDPPGAEEAPAKEARGAPPPPPD